MKKGGKIKSQLDDQLILTLYYDEKKTAQAISEILGVSKTTILNHLHKYDKNKNPILNTPKKRGQNKKHNIPLSDIIELHNQGLYDSEIAEILGCTRSNITIRLNKAGITDRKSKQDDIALRNRISNSLRGRYVGKDNPRYKGYTNEKIIARGLFKTISKEIIRNRNYTCEVCGQHGGDLEVHHIKPFSVILDNFIQTTYSGDIGNFVHELMECEDFYDRENLILLCKKCHHNVHYSDNPDLSPLRWERATTIESRGLEPIYPDKQVEQI